MSTQVESEEFDQLELFRPPPSRPQWEALPPDVQTEARELVVQMLRAYVDRDAREDRKEVRDD